MGSLLCLLGYGQWWLQLKGHRRVNSGWRKNYPPEGKTFGASDYMTQNWFQAILNSFKYTNKGLQHTTIYFIMSSRWRACGTISWTSISPMDGSRVLNNPCHFGPRTTLFKSLCLCLGSPGHPGNIITLAIVGCRLFCLVWN